MSNSNIKLYRIIGKIKIKNGKPYYDTKCLEEAEYIDEVIKGNRKNTKDSKIDVEYRIMLENDDIVYKEKVIRSDDF